MKDWIARFGGLLARAAAQTARRRILHECNPHDPPSAWCGCTATAGRHAAFDLTFPVAVKDSVIAQNAPDNCSGSC